ncbi:DUF4870 family protein [Sneathiella sp. HT1-7]|jgi:uncharacterized membrane protein|uniref:DUF4870 family protein n=1 Tax=Sneathiella sp. HT1-7 TaxID=2887192 RepID=UPI001D1509BD|nr:DUF4870 domain-containing protein [Sneathiella sp. HT1-7]MCC3306489.1 hypothetical protein [Sneathiella sp. HT1-7]
MNDITGQTENEARMQGAVKMAQIIYFIYLAGLIFPIAHVVGVVMAYINRGDGAPWVETHFRFQIRSFWILFLYCVIGSLLMFVGIGFLIILAAYIWFIIRCVKGLKLHARNEPVPNPETWLW